MKPAIHKARWKNSRWVLAVVLVLAACTRAPPEERLRATVAGLEAAIEQHDTSSLQDAIASDFIGPDGLDRDGARRMAQLMFLRYRDVRVTLGPLHVELAQEHATIRCTAAITSGAGFLPENGQVYDVETGWRLEGGEWRLVNAHWQPRL
jgi:hypothetical protein